MLVIGNMQYDAQKSKYYQLVMANYTLFYVALV